MALHPLAARFAEVADVYERGRPDYPPAVVGALAAEAGLAAGDPVLDLAAGTGKLTRALLAGGYDVVAVEPLAALREVLTTLVGADRVREGVAEEIPLPDGSVAAVTVADAFHWFDQQAALGEIARVLHPGGTLVLISTIPDWRDAPWGHDVGTALSEARTAHPYFDGTPWQETLTAAPAWTDPRHIRVTTMQPVSADRIADYVRSMSWVAAMDEPVREALLARIAVAMDGADMPDELPIGALMWLSSLR